MTAFEYVAGHPFLYATLCNKIRAQMAGAIRELDTALSKQWTASAVAR